MWSSTPQNTPWNHKLLYNSHIVLKYSHNICVGVYDKHVAAMFGFTWLFISCTAPGPRTDLVLDLPTIIGIAVAGAAVLILIFLILLVSICICRFNASRQGFYTTDEDKAANPPSMLRYSASLRSISSQAVVPIIDGKGQLTEKENEFYV